LDRNSRVTGESIYILHQRPFSESSSLIEGFSRNHGRLALMAKGVKKKKSRYRGILLPFQKITISWSGKGEVKTMTNADMESYRETLTGERLFCGYYLNELIMLSLHRGDPHEKLFDFYENTINKLNNKCDIEQTLRIFEKNFLQEIGYGLNLTHDVSTRTPINPNVTYLYVWGLGAVPQSSVTDNGILITGASLLALHEEVFFNELNRRELKHLTRGIIDYQLGGKILKSRRLYSYLFSNQ
tara:strand:+ start:397 stop:1122 length:726 start_codon:yes stop_codon:yes gene_type:complete